MEVFRIALESHSGKLTAPGTAARWNKENQFVLYTGHSRSLASLEVVVHRNNLQSGKPYKVMVLSLRDDESLVTRLRIRDLPVNWRTLAAYSAMQEIGSNWYSSRQSLILQVPSVIIPQEYNYIINLYHPDMSDTNVSLVRTEPYFWDNRLV
jgi:RES domain-containing protein